MGCDPSARVAEPQVVGRAPRTTRNDRKAKTMKTYILRAPKTVEPQRAPHPARPHLMNNRRHPSPVTRRNKNTAGANAMVCLGVAGGGSTDARPCSQRAMERGAQARVPFPG
jgi:hypothetical protein